MLKFSKKVEYALIALVYMSQKPEEDLTTSRELAGQFNIPAEVAGKVLQSLGRQQIIRSVQGVKGGYRICNQPSQINLAEVITAVDGPISVVGCLTSNEDCSCDQHDYCNIRTSMELVHRQIMLFFQSISLSDIVERRIPTAPIDPVREMLLSEMNK